MLIQDTKTDICTNRFGGTALLNGLHGGGNGHHDSERSSLPLHHFRADDYDHLIDCPVECSNHRVLTFEVDGVKHQIAIWGRGNEDAERLRKDVQAAVQEGQ